MKLRLAQIITGLTMGGAQAMLYKLASQLDRRSFETQVISLLDGGDMSQRIAAMGIPVRSLGMRPGRLSPSAIPRLAWWLRRSVPQVIQTWMYHADLVGGLAAKLAGGIPVVWGVRQSNLDPAGTKRTTIWTARACARLSRILPVRIVCCSEASRRAHQDLGYAAEKLMVIPNGFDLDAFRPDREARRAVRRELSIDESTLLIGLVGRFDPQKDHRNFVQAAVLLHARFPDVHFLLCGEGITWANERLTEWIRGAAIGHRSHLLGERDDVARLDAALDIASSSSFGEGFSNAIGEAMACGVPCVATDVGDSARLIGETGRVVPARNAGALADAWQELVELGTEGRRRLGLEARRRIENHFSLPAVTARYARLYEELSSDVRS